MCIRDSSRYVLKWKWINDAEGKSKRIIRARMAIRGFQDWLAFQEANFSPTASRLSQKLICSETACHDDWIMVTVDIEKAFLQGFTYKEIEEATGEPEREILFSLPPGSAAVLRKIKGYEDFGETQECLRCLKPGTGTKGAPRAFSLKLSSILRGKKCKFQPSTMDPELELRFDNGVLVCTCSTHVDDLKFGGREHIIKNEIIPCLLYTSPSPRDS